MDERSVTADELSPVSFQNALKVDTDNSDNNNINLPSGKCFAALCNQNSNGMLRGNRNDLNSQLQFFFPLNFPFRPKFSSTRRSKIFKIRPCIERVKFEESTKKKKTK